MNDTIERSQTHATFVIERTYPVPVDRVWHALSDNDARDQWFGGGPSSTPTRSRTTSASAEHGTRTASGTAARDRGSCPPTPTSSTSNGSSSPTTCGSTTSTCPPPSPRSRWKPDGDRTSLTYTEQGVHFDGLDSVEGREEGTRGLLDQLGSYLTTGH